MNIITTVQELIDHDDWGYVFCEPGYSGSSITDDVEPVAPGVSNAKVLRKDVKRILFCEDNGDREWEGTGVFEMKDGRFLYADGGCDYTGWG